MNNIIGYVKEIIGNFTATDNVDGSVRNLQLNDPIYEGEFVVSDDSEAKIVIGFNDDLQEIELAGNDGLLFDAALLAAKFDIGEPDIEVLDEENETDEDEDDAPSAGEEDLEDENDSTGGFGDRSAGETNVNSDLSTAAFITQEPEPLPKSDEKLESHASFSIANPTTPTVSDNAAFTPQNPVVAPVSPPTVINTPPPVTIPILPPVITSPELVDDVPVAVADVNSISEDSQPNIIVGNVVSNDDIGSNIPDFPVTSVNGKAVGTLIEGNYGTVVIDQDGNYRYQLLNEHLAVQGLSIGESLTEVFTYTITDLDGDSDTTTLTITINGTNDGVTLAIPDNVGVAGGDEEQVFERGLTHGSTPNNEDIVSSSFMLKALDGLANISINGTIISAQALSNSASTPITLTTAIGSLALNGYAMATDGTITVDYTYTLAAEQNHSNSAISDDITIQVTDTDGDSTTDTLNIAIVNDVPIVVSDSNTLNDKGISVSANVFTNDTLGADQTLTPVTGVAFGQSNNVVSGNINSAVIGSYGSVVVQADGSYIYRLDDTNLAIRNLALGKSVTEVFTYTITDSDGDTATTTLTITINGTNDGVILTIPDNVGVIGGDEEQVFERGLANGSTPNNDDVVSSRFTLKALDGLANISLNGTIISTQALSDSANTPITLTTTIGSLVLNGYTMAADGSATVSYTYTLTARQDHRGGTISDDITIKVTDIDGDSTMNVLNIAIVDDAPVAVSDSNTITEDSASVSANVFTNDTLGADQILTPVTGVTSGQSNNAVSGNINSTVIGSYGSVVVQADGSYIYRLDNTNLAVQDLTTAESLTDVFTYTITDSDGDTATTTLTITIDGTDDGVTLTIPDNVGTAGGDDERVFERGLANGSTPNNDDVVNSSFTLKALDGLANISLNGTVISAQALSGSAATPITLTTAKGSLVLNGYAMATDGTITVNYTYTLTAQQNHSSGAINDDITIKVTDTDGDSSTDVLNINIVDDVPTANNDITRNVIEGGNTITGNVINNTTDSSGSDVLSADSSNTIASFTYTNEAGVVVAGTLGASVDTKYGGLTLKADGSWTFISDHTEDHSTTDPLSEQFTYTLIDNDGDSDTAVQVITVSDGTNTTIDNPIAIVYEGSSIVTFNGVDNYNKSISNAVQGGNSTLTHKLDFTADSDAADIMSFTFDGITKTIDPSAPSNSETIVSTGNKGTLTVFYNGTWSYTPPATYVHDAADGVNNFQTTFTYIVKDSDGDIVTGSQTIQVDDTLPVLNSATNSTIDEQYLATGSQPNTSELTKTGTVSAVQKIGAVDIKFLAMQTELQGLIDKGFSSGNNVVSYVVSGDGHTLTASANGSPAFIITLTNATNASTVGYTVQLLKPLDHESAILSNNNIVMNLAIGIFDDDGDSDDATFNVTIIDDVPATTKTMTVNEDSNVSASENTINTHADVTQANTTITTNGSYGSATINANGTLSYTPNSNFSGKDIVAYTTKNEFGADIVTTVTITVTPIADKPINLVDNTSLRTAEDTAVALGLNAPTQPDNTDLSGTSDDMDNPELYDAITLSGISAGAMLVKSDGSTLVHTADGNPITVVLSNGQHVAGTTGTLTMTVAEYESMKIKPPLDSHNNISFTVSVSSYEVNKDGSKIVGVSGAAATPETVNIDVQAVTDPVSLTYSGAASLTIDEDTSFDLSADLSETFGDKVDGSETFTYEFTNVPEGAKLTVNGNVETAPASGTVYVTFTGTTPTVKLTPPKDFSGDIGTITITLKAVDSDSDSTDVAPIIKTESDSVTLNLYVNPIANDVKLSAPNAVAEDTPVAFLTKLSITDKNNDGNVADHDNDGHDRITEVTIGNLDNGFELTTADGTNLYTSPSDNNSFTIIIGTTINPQTSNPFTISEVTGILLNSHRAHSSADISLDVTVKAIDSQHVNGSDVDSAESTTLFTAANGNPLNIKVTAVSESKLTDSDGANGNDVTSQGDHTYTTHVNEDSSWINLNTLDGGFNLAASNEDDKNSGIAGTSNSETTTINFSNVPVGSQFTIDGGTTVLTVTDMATGIDIPLADLGSLQFKPVAQFSGSISIHMKVKTTDQDEDGGSPSTTVTSAHDTLTLVVDPIADNVTLAIKQASGNEDAGRSAGNNSNTASAATINNAVNGIALDITTTTDDTDNSETFVVTISSIPDGGEIYYNGTLMNNSSGVSGDLTATNDVGTTWSIKIENFNNNAPLTFIPPHNDDSNYTFNVSAYSVDGAHTTAASPQTLTIDVDVKGVADTTKNTELNGFDLDGSSNNATGIYNYVTTEAVLDSSTNQFDFKEIYQTPNTINSYDDDSSESLTVAITGLDSQFSIENATFMGGTGTARQWLFKVEDLNNIKVKSPINFSGEIAFTVKYITTESEGDSATHPTENVKVLVTPSPEATLNKSTTIDEDKLTKLDFAINHQQGDTNETVETVYINKADLAASNVTLYLGNSTTETLAQAVSTNADISDDGTFYVLKNGTFDTIYALSSADLHGNNSFAFKYDIKDSATIGTTENIKQSSLENYNITVKAITDDIKINLGTINGGASGVVSGTDVTVTNNTTVTVDVNVMANDDSAEGSNGADIDGSEQVTRFVIENVSAGITVVGGIYAGDIYNTTTSQYENSGIWYLNVNEALNATGVDRTISFKIDSDTNSFNTSTIKITAFNEDNNNSVLQDDSTSFTIIKDNNYIGGNQAGTPATISVFSVKPINIIEDTAFTLDNAISVTLTGSSAFTIVLTNVVAGATVTGAQKQGDTWVINGNGDSSAVLAAIQAVTITPPAHFNSFNNADTDTFVFNATITTYDASSQHTSTLSFDKPVYPVTDNLTIAVTQDGTTAEDTNQQFTLTLSNPADGANTTIIDGKIYLKVTENYTDTGSTTGTLFDGLGNNLTTEINPAGLPAGSYYVVSNVSYDDILNFTFAPGGDRQGSVNVDVYTQNQEAHGWGGVHPNGGTTVNLSHQQFSFNVTPVIDGSTLIANNVSGIEDAIIANGANRVALDLSQSHNDPSESLVSALLDNIPAGFLVYYQDPSDPNKTLLAHNAGKSTEFGSQFNQWSIPLNSGALPNKVYIQAPENWSGTVNNIKFTTITAEEGITTLFEKFVSFELQISAVADGLTLNSTKAFGKEGDDIALNLNANVNDLDGSETVKITLAGLGADANFKVNSQDINNSDITYNSGSDTYTIINIAVTDINNLSFVQQDFNGTINVTAQTVESGNNDSSTIVNDSFSVQVSNVTATSTDDTLFYQQGSNVNALAGNDTLILSHDVGIDFSSLTNADGIKNQEIIDLQQNGDHNLEKLSLQDVIDMTDSDNDLIIQGDANDNLSFANNDGWVKGSSTSEGGHDYDVYTNTNDATVSVKVEQEIIDIIL